MTWNELRSARQIGDELTLKCGACGHNQKIIRPQGSVMCFYCHNEPEEVLVKASLVFLADETSHRWFR